MWLNQTAAPSVAPITLAEAKAQCRVDHADEDALITSLIAAMTERLDGRFGYLGRCLITQSWEYRVHGFPSCGVICLPMPPLQSVSGVTYVDDAGVVQTLAADQYVVDTATFEGQIRRAYDVVWPVTRLEAYAVRVAFVAGFGDAEDVPAPIKTAMLMMIQHLYDNRGSIPKDEDGKIAIPPASVSLLSNYRLDPI